MNFKDKSAESIIRAAAYYRTAAKLARENLEMQAQDDEFRMHHNADKAYFNRMHEVTGEKLTKEQKAMTKLQEDEAERYSLVTEFAIDETPLISLIVEALSSEPDDCISLGHRLQKYAQQAFESYALLNYEDD